MRRFHAGVHVLVLHEATGHLMTSELFLTWQPTAHKMLATMMTTLQAGRLVLCLGVVSGKEREDGRNSGRKQRVG